MTIKLNLARKSGMEFEKKVCPDCNGSGSIRSMTSTTGTPFILVQHAMVLVKSLNYRNRRIE